MCVASPKLSPLSYTQYTDGMIRAYREDELERDRESWLEEIVLHQQREEETEEVSTAFASASPGLSSV
jgi:hypothetical protein